MVDSQYAKESAKETVNLPMVGPVDKKKLLIGGAVVLGLLIVLYIIRSRSSA